jgi:Ca2+-binding EF-hand superfamily protein
MNRKWLMVVMLISMFTTVQSFAQDKEKRQRPDGGKMFATLDTDNDGKISVAEADKAQRGKLKENFVTIDTNKDNYLDKEELKAYREKRKAERAEKKDKQK